MAYQQENPIYRSVQSCLIIPHLTEKVKDGELLRPIKIVIDLGCVVAIIGAGSIKQRGFQIRLYISDLTRIFLQAIENILNMSRMNLEHTAYYHFGGNVGLADNLSITLTAYTFKHYLHDFVNSALTLPNIAEQVIIFIKDTDGEIAEEYLSDKIGAKYEFDKKSETETYFKERC